MLRKLPNGDLYAPHRGKPPACPDGYVRDTGDIFIFHPVVNDCINRIEKKVPCNCGHPKIILWCSRDNVSVNLGTCKECQDET